MDYSLTMRKADLQHLQELLFPVDGMEAVAFVLCGTARWEDRTRLLVHEIIELPASAYIARSEEHVDWETRALLPALARLENEGLVLLKCHSHPGGRPFFSKVDDLSDRQLLRACYQWNPQGPHASLVMTEDAMTGRVVLENGHFRGIDTIQVIGDRIQWTRPESVIDFRPEQRRLIQAFGEGTYRQLRHLRVAVIGASGTGSLVIEALARTGVGHIVVVDPDVIETVNLNRVLHAIADDVRQQTPKVTVARRSIEAMGLEITVTEIRGSLHDPEVVRAVAGCDLVYGCVDNREARQLLCRIAAYYLLPYIDVGVAIHAAGNGDIQNISASIHYLQPGESFLRRGVFDQEALRAEAIKRTDPAHYAEQRRNRYVLGIEVERPAVMPLNMFAAGYAVMELLARIHGYQEENPPHSETLISVDLGLIRRRPDPGLCPSLQQHLGRGDCEPILGLPALSRLRRDVA